MCKTIDRFDRMLQWCLACLGRIYLDGKVQLPLICRPIKAIYRPNRANNKMIWFLVMILYKTAQTQASFQWTQRPGEVLVCVGGEAHFPWDYNNTRYSIQAITYRSSKTGNSLLTRFVSPPHPPEHYGYGTRSAVMGETAAGIILKDVTKNDEGDYTIEPSSPATDDRAQLKIYSKEELSPWLLVDNVEKNFGDTLIKTGQDKLHIVVNTQHHLPANIDILILEAGGFQKVEQCNASKACSHVIPLFGETNITIQATVAYDICSPFTGSIFIYQDTVPPSVAPVVPPNNSGTIIIVVTSIVLVVLVVIIVFIVVWCCLETRQRKKINIGDCGRKYVECIVWKPLQYMKRKCCPEHDVENPSSTDVGLDEIPGKSSDVINEEQGLMDEVTGAFRRLATEKGLTKISINILLDNDFNDHKVIVSITDQRIETMGIKGQAADRLRDWREELREQAEIDHAFEVLMAANEEYRDFIGLARERDLTVDMIETLLDKGCNDNTVIISITDQRIETMDITGQAADRLRDWREKLQAEIDYAFKVLMAAKEEDREFIGLARNAGITLDTINILLDHDFNDTKNAALMRDQDIEGMNITGQQAECLQQWRDDLNSQDGPGDNPEFDVGKCFQELNLKEQWKKDIQKYVDEHGTEGLQEHIKQALDQCLNVPISIAVTGRAGVGKSSLINTLRCLRPTDKGAAAVGVAETTYNLHPYSFPRQPKLLIWDMPGVNTPRFPRASYLSDVEFHKYDCFIVVCTGRFTEDDLYLATEAKKLGKPFYFLRNKIDNDITNSKRDTERPENETLTEIKKDICDNLEAHGLPIENVYLLSSTMRNSAKWDFPTFANDLVMNTPQKNKTSLVMGLVSCSTQIISQKKKECLDRIDTIAMRAATSKNHMVTIQEEIKFYRDQFGLTSSALRDVDLGSLDRRLQDMKNTLDAIIEEPVEEHDTGRKVGRLLLGPLGEMIGGLIDAGVNKRRYDAHRETCASLVKAKSKQSMLVVIEETRIVLKAALDRCAELSNAVINQKNLIDHE